MNEFEKIYEELKNDYSEHFETKRLQVKNEKSFYVLIYIIYAISLILTAFIAIRKDSIIFLALFSIDVLVVPYIIRYVYKTWSKNVDYQKDYIKLIITDIISKFKETKVCKNEKGIEKFKYKDADFDNYDAIYKSKCLVQGTIDEKYNFEMASVYTRNRRMLTMDYAFIFDGTFIILDIPQKFAERIFITNKTKFGLGKPDIIKNDYKIYCKNNLKTKENLNIKLIEELIDSKLFNEIVIQGNKMYLRYYNNIFEVPNYKEEPITKDRLSEYYNTYRSMINGFKKIVNEI